MLWMYHIEFTNNQVKSSLYPQTFTQLIQLGLVRPEMELLP